VATPALNADWSILVLVCERIAEDPLSTVVLSNHILEPVDRLPFAAMRAAPMVEALVSILEESCNPTARDLGIPHPVKMWTIGFAKAVGCLRDVQLRSIDAKIVFVDHHRIDGELDEVGIGLRTQEENRAIPELLDAQIPRFASL
jgi:hypothetical protein